MASSAGGGRGRESDPIDDWPRSWRDVRYVPKAELSIRSKERPYSITSVAATRSDEGIVRPIEIAVLRLMTSSNLTGAWTGSSLGFAPRRMRSA
jgi:hypothetical protein